MAYPAFGVRRSVAGAVTWWGKAWLRALDEVAFDDAERKRARALARGGTVGGIAIARGVAMAPVADGPGLFTAVIDVPLLDDEAAAALVEVVAAVPSRAAELAAGDLPHDLVEHAEAAGVELLPYGDELAPTCSCRSWVDPCVHVLALGYQLAWLLDVEPLLLLHLRGLSPAELAVRVRALGPPPDDPDPDSFPDHPADGPDGLDDPHDPVELAAEAAVRAADLLAELDRAGGLRRE